jgi:dynein heavy chain
MVMELRYEELQERYRTRLLYALNPLEEDQYATELADAQQLRLEWQDLVDEAEKVDAGLYAVKTNFTETTKEQVCLLV